jgi:hypothetical protein
LFPSRLLLEEKVRTSFFFLETFIQRETDGGVVLFHQWPSTLPSLRSMNLMTQFSQCSQSGNVKKSPLCKNKLVSFLVIITFTF